MGRIGFKFGTNMFTPVRLEAFAVFLIGLSLAVFGVFPRYGVVGEQLLSDPTFSDDSRSWVVLGEAGAIDRRPDLLSLNGVNGLGRVQQVVETPGVDGLRLLAEFRYRSDKRHKAGSVRLLLLGHRERPRWDLPFGSLEPDFNSSWSTQQVDVRVDAGADVYAVTASNQSGLGSFELRRVELYPLGASPAFRVLSGVLAAGWLGAGVWTLILVVGVTGSRWLKGISALVGLCIVVGVLIPKPSLLQTFRWAYRSLAAHLPIEGLTPTPDYLLHLLQNSMHVLLFAVLTLVFTVSQPRLRMGQLVTGVLIFASSTEVLQWFALDRQPSIGDLGLDLIGAMNGFGVGLIVLMWRRPNDVEELP